MAMRLILILLVLGFTAAIGWTVAPFYEAGLRHLGLHPQPILAPRQ